MWIFDLIYKLIALYHLPLPFIKLIFGDFKDKNFHIKIKDSISQQFFAIFGVPQESELSPKFLNLFINDKFYHPNVRLAEFADNICFFV